MAHSQSPTYDYMQLQNQGRTGRSTDALLGARQNPGSRSAGPATVPAAPNLIVSPTPQSHRMNTQPAKRSPSGGGIGPESAAPPAVTLLENLRIACNYAKATDDKVQRNSRFSNSMEAVLQEGELCLKAMERELQVAKDEANNMQEMNRRIHEQLKDVQAMLAHEQEVRRRENADLKIALDRIQELEARAKDNSLLSKSEKKDLQSEKQAEMERMKAAIWQGEDAHARSSGSMRTGQPATSVPQGRSNRDDIPSGRPPPPRDPIPQGRPAGKPPPPSHPPPAASSHGSVYPDLPPTVNPGSIPSTYLGRDLDRDARTMWVMRHGEKLDDVDESWSQTAERPYDPPITDKGRLQAREAGMRLAGEPQEVTVVVVSPFRRCVETAHEVMLAYEEVLNNAGRRKRPLLLYRDDCVCEVMTTRNVAVQPEFCTAKEIVRLCPGLEGRLRGWEQTPSGVAGGRGVDDGANLAAFAGPNLPEWPETMTGAMARYTESFQRLPSRFPKGHILVVSHGDCVAQFVSMTHKISKELVYQVPYCAIAAANMRAKDGAVAGLPEWIEGDVTLSEDILILQD